MTLLQPTVLVVLVAFFLAFQLVQAVYHWKFHPSSKLPGPWHTSLSSWWIRWQRWNGRLSNRIDELITAYGPVVRIGPKMVIVNDPAALEPIFARRDMDTAPSALRAVRIGGYDWTLTIPNIALARERRHPLIIATAMRGLQRWHSRFLSNASDMVRQLEASQGTISEDIVYHVRAITLQMVQAVLTGRPEIHIDQRNFAKVVREFNFLVLWRFCLPSWAYSWLSHSPFANARFRARSGDMLLQVGKDLEEDIRNTSSDPQGPDTMHSAYHLLTGKGDSGKGPLQDRVEASAELAGLMLAATDTTSSALAFLLYELAKNPGLSQDLYIELKNVSDDHLEACQLLDACISEGLRFRPPIALTGSRLVPRGGLEILGHYIPEGTIITTQSISYSRHMPSLFPDCDVFNPRRWLDARNAADMRKLVAPFGIGARRCPGINLALYQMRLIVSSIIRSFEMSVPPETTPESMEPFEASGYRTRYDQCYLRFYPRQRCC